LTGAVLKRNLTPHRSVAQGFRAIKSRNYRAGHQFKEGWSRMAKGKHAAALFEVINRDSGLSGRGSSSNLSTPKWWFKRQRSASSAAPVVARSVPESSGEFDPTAAHFAAPASAEPAASESSGNSTMHIDRDRQLISLRVSYVSAIVSGFALIVVLLLVFVIGKRVGRSVVPAAVVSSEDLKKYPPYPQVLDVRQGASRPALMAVASEPGVAAVADTSGAEGAGTPVAAPLVVHDVKRQVGLNYVVVQSYPAEKDANEARDLLIKHGVNCTVEKPPEALRLPDKWFSVIGTAGFERISTREWENYIASIGAVSTKFEATGKTAGASKFKRFQPLGVKWRETK
jgi:hypothetical protein